MFFTVGLGLFCWIERTIEYPAMVARSKKLTREFTDKEVFDFIRVPSPVSDHSLSGSVGAKRKASRPFVSFQRNWRAPFSPLVNDIAMSASKAWILGLFKNSNLIFAEKGTILNLISPLTGQPFVPANFNVIVGKPNAKVGLHPFPPIVEGMRFPWRMRLSIISQMLANCPGMGCSAFEVDAVAKVIAKIGSTSKRLKRFMNNSF